MKYLHIINHSINNVIHFVLLKSQIDAENCLINHSINLDILNTLSIMANL